MLEKVSRIHETYLLDQQLFSNAEVVQNTDLNILALYLQTVNMSYIALFMHIKVTTSSFRLAGKIFLKSIRETFKVEKI